MSDFEKKKQLIKARIDDLLESGMNDKSEIYSKIVEEFGVARPEVRRIARDFRNEMEKKVRILQNEVPE